MMPELPISELLAQYRTVVDLLDEVNARKTTLEKQKEALKYDILGAMTASGFTEDGAKVAANGVSATRGTKFRAVYQPEKWPELVKWCAEHGRADLIQRRLTDSRVLEMVDAGEPLPEGVNLEPFQELSLRRI